jgi:hypothetical protein
MDELEAIQRRLAQVRREIAVASEHLQQLRDEEYGLSLAVARLTSGPLPEPTVDHTSPAPATAGESKVRITPAVRAILTETDHPLTRHEIAKRLSELGLSVSPDTVSASLSYLRKAGTARNAAGRWYLANNSSAAP